MSSGGGDVVCGNGVDDSEEQILDCDSQSCTCQETGNTNPVALYWYDRIHNNETGRCLDSNYQGHVYAIECNGGDYQRWNRWHVGQGVFELYNAQTGRCLDSNHQGEVYTLPCNNGSYQRWYADGNTIHSIETGLCLDSNHLGQVYTLGCNSGNFQNWIGEGDSPSYDVDMLNDAGNERNAITISIGTWNVYYGSVLGRSALDRIMDILQVARNRNIHVVVLQEVPPGLLGSPSGNGNSAEQWAVQAADMARAIEQHGYEQIGLPREYAESATGQYCPAGLNADYQQGYLYLYDRNVLEAVGTLDFFVPERFSIQNLWPARPPVRQRFSLREQPQRILHVLTLHNEAAREHAGSNVQNLVDALRGEFHDPNGPHLGERWIVAGDFNVHVNDDFDYNNYEIDDLPPMQALFRLGGQNIESSWLAHRPDGVRRVLDYIVSNGTVTDNAGANEDAAQPVGGTRQRLCSDAHLALFGSITM
ncbi:ricin-type beta-trefoil lectin domain protein [Sorangium cellulosum]|uniref:ricin-type beta-trefoil lectin domain protein n=1 Tax=Sorangium cellulosum TaxID=56 RepID=UPI0009B90C00|nr:ricin-type beta-trefoil lectin domain protein [Sorangium cellulosum]